MKMDKNLIFCKVFLAPNPVNILSRSATAELIIVILGKIVMRAEHDEHDEHYEHETGNCGSEIGC